MTKPKLTPNNKANPLPPTPLLPFTLKVDASLYRKSIGPGRIILALAISSIFWFKYGPLFWLFTVLGIAALIAGTVYMLSRRSITVDNQGVHFKTSYGLTKSAKFDEIQSVEVFNNYSDVSFGDMPRIIAAKKSGGYLFSIIGLFWPHEGMATLLSSFQDNKVALNFHNDIVQSSDIAKEFPKLVPFYEKYPYLAAGVGLVVAVAAIIAGILIFAM